MKIAVLITSYNRVQTTIKCLSNVLNQKKINEKFIVDIYLVDDKSTDNTSEIIKNKFQEIYLINGTGKLYWNKGMILAWQTAVEKKEYDFYLWLNDDTFIHHDAILHMIECYNESLSKNHKFSIIVGACKEPNKEDVFSYGLRDDNGPIIPNGNIQNGKYINGNIVLISNEIYKINGMLSDFYSHSFGDVDYGLSCLKKNINIFTTKKFIASCSTNEIIPPHFDSKNSLVKRFKFLNSPKGHSIRECFYFRKKFWGWKSIFFLTALILKVSFPSSYKKVVSSYNFLK